MRVLAYNAQSCRAGVQAVAAVIRGAAPDVAALNEVRRRQARAIGRLVGMHVTFGSTLRWRAFGNAVLSNQRPVYVRSAAFTISSREPRGMVTLTLPEGVVVAGLHLGLTGDERVAQAGEVLTALPSEGRVVLAGDLNEEPDGLAVKVISSRLRDAYAVVGSSNGFTFPANAPTARIDYVFVSEGIRVVSASVLPDGASDHLAVVADLEVG